MAHSQVLIDAFNRPVYVLTQPSTLAALCKGTDGMDGIDLEVQIHGITDAKALQQQLITSNKLNAKNWLSEHQVHDGPTLTRGTGLYVRADLSLYDTPAWLRDAARNNQAACEAAYDAALQGKQPKSASVVTGDGFDHGLTTLLELSITFNVCKNRGLSHRFALRAQAADACKALIKKTTDPDQLHTLKQCVTTLPLFTEHQSLFGRACRFFSKQHAQTKTQTTLLQAIQQRLDAPPGPSDPGDIEMKKLKPK